MTDWISWHDRYDQPDSELSRRLEVVRGRIDEGLSRCAPGPIRVISMCAGEGRDILHVLESHDRAGDVTGRLVELDPVLAARAEQKAPPGIKVVRGDASISDIYEGAAPADLLLSCGIFGNISEEDIRRTIDGWAMLCAERATVIWTRGGGKHDIRDEVRRWVTSAGFEELAYEGPPADYGVGVARMVREPAPLLHGIKFFTFLH